MEEKKGNEALKPIVNDDEYKCGNCGHKLEEQVMLGDYILFHTFYKICPKCRKAVKWDD